MDLGAALASAGRGMLVNADYQGKLAHTAQTQANTELTRSNTDSVRMQQLAMQEEKLQRQQLAEDAQRVTGEFEGGIKTQAQMAEASNKLANLAWQRGDTKTAREQQGMAEAATKAVKAEAAGAVTAQQARMEAASLASSEYLAAPSPEAAQEVSRRAVLAGLNPPLPSSPQFAKWVQQMPTLALNSEKRTEFAQKQLHQDETRTRQEERDAEIARHNRRQEAQTAQYQQGLLELRREKAAETKAAAVAKASALPPLRPQQIAHLETLAKNSHEAVRSLKAMSEFPIGTTGSSFADLVGHSATPAIIRAAANHMTPELKQAYTTAGNGLARSISYMETGGVGSRGATQSQTEAVHRAVIGQDGDSPMTIAYKHATGAAAAKASMEMRRTHPDPRIEGHMQKDEEFFGSFPQPNDILKAAMHDPKQLAEINRFRKSKTYADGQAAIKELLELKRQRLATTAPADVPAVGAPPPGMVIDK